MRRLAAETPEERKHQPGRFFSVKKALVAVPLIAGLVAGCTGDAGGQLQGCRSYNETTITINRDTDGQSVSLRDIESIPPGSFLTDAQIDFMNEAHAISSEGIPIGTKVTQAPPYCLIRTNGVLKSAYTQPVSEGGMDKGIYIPENPELVSISMLNMANHEIGHLQTGNPVHGSEALSQLNEYEQKLSGFMLLLRQGVDFGQLVRWVSHESQSGIFGKCKGFCNPDGDSPAATRSTAMTGATCSSS